MQKQFLIGDLFRCCSLLNKARVSPLIGPCNDCSWAVFLLHTELDIDPNNSVALWRGGDESGMHYVTGCEAMYTEFSLPKLNSLRQSRNPMENNVRTL